MRALKKYIPKNWLPILIWIKTRPMTDAYTVVLIFFPWLNVALKYIRQSIHLGFWINEEPYANFFVINVKNLGADVLKNFLVTLSGLAVRNTPLHLSVVVPPEHFDLVTDLQAATKTLPRNCYGDVNFFTSVEDCNQWLNESVSGRYAVSPMLPVDVNKSAKLVPPAHYLNWARGFLKSLGPHRRVYFCNFEDAKPEFFESQKGLQEEAVFIVRTQAPVPADLQYRFGNVIYLSRMGLATAELIALVHLCDGYLGLSDHLQFFAQQRGFAKKNKGDEKTHGYADAVLI